MGGCYCGGGRPSRIVQPLVIQRTLLRRALVMSVVLHAAAGAFAWWTIVPAHVVETELVDIEVAPLPPKPEALLPEVARPPAQDLAGHETPPPDPEAASTAPSQPGEGAIDAGVDAAPDASPDASPDARPDARPDAAIDAGVDAPLDGGAPDDAAPPDAMAVASTEPEARDDAGATAAADAGGDASAVQVAIADAGDDALQVARADAGDTPQVASTGSGAGSSAGSGAGFEHGVGCGIGHRVRPGVWIARGLRRRH